MSSFCHLLLLLFRHLMQIIIIIPASSMLRPGLMSLFEVEFALARLVREVQQQQRLIGIHLTRIEFRPGEHNWLSPSSAAGPTPA